MRAWRRTLAPGLAVGLAGALASATPLGFGLEEDPGLPLLFRLRGPVPPPPDVAIVRVDRAVVRALRDPDGGALPPRLEACGARAAAAASAGRATDAPPGPPFGDPADVRAERIPRLLYACAVEELTRQGAAAVALNVAFVGPAPGTTELAAAVRGHGRTVLLALVEAQGPARVQRLPASPLRAAAAGTAPFLTPSVGRRVLQFWVCYGGVEPAVGPAAGGPPPGGLAAGRAPAPPGGAPADACRPVRDAAASQLPTRALEALAAPARARVGALVLGPAAADDPGAFLGWLAEYGPRLEAGGSPGDGLARVRAALGPGEAGALAALARVAAGPAERYANAYGPPGTVPSVSVLDLFAAPEAEAPMAGRTVFVGYQELASPDRIDAFRGPVDRADGVPTSGVEWAATAYANLRHGSHVVALPEGARLLLVAALGVGFAAAAAAGPPWAGFLLLAGAAGAWLAAAAFAFAAWQLWLPLVVPLVLQGPLALIAAGAARVTWLRDLARDTLPAWAQARGTRRAADGRVLAELDMTVLLTDVVGSTGWQARLGPDGWRRAIDDHFGLLAACAAREGGTVFEQTGDGLLIGWGYPPSGGGDHADRALRAARAMAAALSRPGPAGAGPPALRVRIGVHSGPTQVSWVGPRSARRVGPHGATVSVTQRLEQLARELCPDGPPAAVVLSDETRRRATPGRFALRAMGEHAMRGFEAAGPRPVWRLVAGPGTEGPPGPS